MLLSRLITLNRRYSRSVNLERDIKDADAVRGYIATPRTISGVARIAQALEKEEGSRSFTITAVYGTGKSAFAQFLVHALNARDSLGFKIVAKIVKQAGEPLVSSFKSLRKRVKSEGMTSIVCSGSREAIANTLQRALLDNLSLPSKSASALKKYQKMSVVELLQLTLRQSKNGVVLIVDELGKALEYAALNNSAEHESDLYLLQQIAELASEPNKPLLFICLLHQSFADYASSLQASERAEWAKIQGRFEDIPLQDSPENSLALVASVIQQEQKIQADVKSRAKGWSLSLKHLPAFHEISLATIAALYPLHPVTARILPILSNRFAQNERSLFSFLTGNEPFGFRSFLAEHIFDQDMVTLKLHYLYDYFIESLSATLSLQAQFTRWLEINDIIKDANGLPLEEQNLLKTIGLLNLVSISGALRASREFVVVAMSDLPLGCDKKSDALVSKNLISLEKRGLLVYRKINDEYRLWEGSDFDIEPALDKAKLVIASDVSKILNRFTLLSPQVAQRHSLQTGTLRYFMRHFIDNYIPEELLHPTEAAGIVVLALDNKIDIEALPRETQNNKAIIVIKASRANALKSLVKEFAALEYLANTAIELQNDIVARKEIKFRIKQTKAFIEQEVHQCFDFKTQKVDVYFQGKKEFISKDIRKKGLGAVLSYICDKIYSLSDTSPYYYNLNNELINRNCQSVQISKARKILIEAMREHHHKYLFNLKGNGPEVTIYHSVFKETGLHSVAQETLFDKEHFVFTQPKDKGLKKIFLELEKLCLASSDEALALDQIYDKFNRPPYGVPRAVLPIFLFAIYYKHENFLNLYREGSFIAELRSEHIELILKRPEKFQIKYFAVDGLRASFFNDLQRVVNNGKEQSKATPLSVVKPLLKFGQSLPRYTQYTKHLSEEAIRLRKALTTAREPDVFLFESLPQAVNLPALRLNVIEKIKNDHSKILTRKVVEALNELQRAYPNLLEKCKHLIKEAFSAQSLADGKNSLREILGARALPLASSIVDMHLLRLVRAIIDDSYDDKKWLESLIMVIADKPAESWLDEDFATFEINLKDLSRRFINIEFIHVSNRKTNTNAFDSRLLSLVNPNGDEKRKLLMIEKDCDGEALLAKLFEAMPELKVKTAELNALGLSLLDYILQGDKKQDVKSQTKVIHI